MEPETSAQPVDPSNADSARAWDGDDGRFWADHETIFDDSLARYRDRYLESAAIAVSDRVLDIGCGNGQTTRDAAIRAAKGSVLGVDLSSRMIDRARRRAREDGITNATFVQADAQIHTFDARSFDVVISRTGAMFFGDPVAAFTNIARAMQPGGRISLFVWQPVPLNHWVRDFSEALAGGQSISPPAPDAPGPFSLADPDRARAVLTAAGYSEVTFDGVSEEMWFGTDAHDAYEFVRSLGFVAFRLRSLDLADRDRALDSLRASIDAHATGDGVLYPSAAWIIRARI